MRSRGWGSHERDERPWKRGPDGVASVSTTCGTQCEDGGLAARGGGVSPETHQPAPRPCASGLRPGATDSCRVRRPDSGVLPRGWTEADIGQYWTLAGDASITFAGPWTRSRSASPGGGLGLLCTDPPGLRGPGPILLILPPLPDGLPEPALYYPRQRPGHSRRKHFWKSPVHPT